MEITHNTEIIKALIKVQQELKPVRKNATNPHFNSNYADLLAIVEASTKVLCSNGFAISQTTGFVGDKFVLTTTLYHVSGNCITGNYWINARDLTNPQQIASSVTYARRYGLAAIIGLVAEGDDDDGNKAALPIHKEPERMELKSLPELKGDFKIISKPQANRLYAIAKSSGFDDKVFNNLLFQKWGFKRTTDVTPQLYNEIVNYFSRSLLESAEEQKSLTKAVLEDAPF